MAYCYNHIIARGGWTRSRVHKKWAGSLHRDPISVEPQQWRRVFIRRDLISYEYINELCAISCAKSAFLS